MAAADSPAAPTLRTRPHSADGLRHLGDFTTTARVLLISGLSIVIGVVASYVALALLKLIGLFTNLFFFQRAGTALVSPAGHHLGVFVILVPVIGGLVVGLMARYGSERIRGHGIPEAIEAILINGSRVEPQGRAAQAALGGDLDRIGRAVRRRGADHHDRRRVRVARRAVLSSHERRAQDAARRGRGGGHVGDVRGAGRVRHARRRAAALRAGSRAA